MSVRALCSLALLCSGLAARTKLESSEDKASFGAHTSAGQTGTVGQVLRGRYRLEEFIERRSLRVSPPHGEEDPDAVDVFGEFFKDVKGLVTQFHTGRFPERLKERFQNAKSIAKGSFGEVWRATDTMARNKNDQRVAIKLLVTQGRFGPKFMTWTDAKVQQLLGKVDREKQECENVKNMMSNNNMRRDPVGASRICRCIEHNIDEGAPLEPLFFVLEDCGTSVADVISRGAWPLSAREMTSQLLEGLRFLELLKLIHHDLKPANVCIKVGMDRSMSVKIIDWGGLVAATRDNQGRPNVLTPMFAPPEGLVRGGFELPGHSFDVYAAGLIFLAYRCRGDVVARFRQPDLARAGTWQDLERAAKYCNPLLTKLEFKAIAKMTAPKPGERPAPEQARKSIAEAMK